MKEKISIVSCPDYSFERVLTAIKTSTDFLGGLQHFVKPGNRVLIKPNLLSGRPPEKAVTTHPAVVKATIQLVKEAGGTPFLGDSPGGGNLLKVAEKTGIKEVADEMGCPLVEFTEVCEVEGSDGRTFKKIEVAKMALEADAVISLPKVKTHSLTLLTLGIKNMFGCVPGMFRKTQWHLSAGADPKYFAEMLVELYGIIRPELTIVDGILGMEGNGPNMGKPCHLGLVFSGVDCVALDAIITEVLCLPIKEVITTKIAMEKGLGVGDLKRIEVLGEKIEDVRIRGFKTPKGFSPDYIFVKVLSGLFSQSMTARPVWIEDKCSACGTCVDACPPKAIRLEKEGIKIDYKNCIRCFCCSEICTEDAMDMGQGFLLKLISKWR
jgi:uncharacterized protein (DUF362 family)/Pyruvate/2-oxoacid:ferredoxin oxidoreductase delta subunit